MQKSGFFNSSSGDRVYDAADFAAYFGRLVSNGIFYANTNSLKVSAGSGMTVSVSAGAAWINGYSYENTSPHELILATADGVYPRIDRVVVRLSIIDREIVLAVLTGTPSASPTAPPLTRTSDVYELCLAEIEIPQGAVTVGEITDTRLDTELCGLVGSLVSAVYE
jgi:hypothetical protein